MTLKEFADWIYGQMQDNPHLSDAELYSVQIDMAVSPHNLKLTVDEMGQISITNGFFEGAKT